GRCFTGDGIRFSDYHLRWLGYGGIYHPRPEWLDRPRPLREHFVDAQQRNVKENSPPLFQTAPAVTNGLAVALSSLIKDAQMRTTLAQTALNDISTRFSLERWNHDLAIAFDRALRDLRLTRND